MVAESLRAASKSLPPLLLLAAAVATLLQPGASPAQDASPSSADPAKRAIFEAYWQEGIKYRVPRPHLAGDLGFEKPVIGERFLGNYLTGTIQFRLRVDAAGYLEEDGLESISDGIEVRSAFVKFTGDLRVVKPVHFSIEVGVVTTDPYLDETYIAVGDLPWVGTLQLGQFSGPMSLESMGSSRDLVFMEQGAAVQAFAPSLKSGMQIGRPFLGERMTFAAGWFTNSANLQTGDSSKSLARLIGRLSWVSPLQEEFDPRRFLHLGLSSSYLVATGDGVQYQSRPESFLAPFLVDTDEVDADGAYILGTELAWVRESNLVQAEFLQSVVIDAPGGTAVLPGFYVFASRLLTGESHPYDRGSGTLGQVIPNHPFRPRAGGSGAWEVGARYSFLDLTDKGVKGGTMNLLTLGTNWYWNRYVRWQFNYIFAGIDEGVSDGRLHVFQGRFQLMF